MVELPGATFLMGSEDADARPEDGEGPVREVDVGVPNRSEIDDEIRLQGDHALKICFSSPPGEATCLGQLPIRGSDIRFFVFPERSRPS